MEWVILEVLTVAVAAFIWREVSFIPGIAGIRLNAPTGPGGGSPPVGKV